MTSTRRSISVACACGLLAAGASCRASPDHEAVATGAGTTASRLRAGCNTPSDTDVLVLYDGKVFTGADRPGDRWAEALAIRGNKIVKVGTSKQVLQYAGGAGAHVDLQGHLVVPGFNDAHVHLMPPNPLGPAINSPYDVMFGPGPSAEEMCARISEVAAGYPEGTWIYGNVGLAFLEDQSVTRAALDLCAPKHPVVLTGWTGHTMYLDTLAMATVGLSETEPDPLGGEYGRYPGTDVLNGVLYEYAEYEFLRRMRMTLTAEAAQAQLASTLAAAVRLGVTSVQDMSMLPWDRLDTILAGMCYPTRLRTICFPLSLDESRTGCIPSPGSTNPNGKLVSTGVKWITDGTPIERLMALREPYADAPSWSGRFNFDDTALEEIVGDAANGKPRLDQRLFHAVGDLAIDRILAAMNATATDGHWRTRRLRIEHGDLIQPEHVSQLVDKGVVVVQNPTHFTMRDVFVRRLGPQRTAFLQPLRTLVEAGVPVALGSDASGGLGNPFVDLMFAVTHPANPGEALTMEQAVMAYTKGGAYAEFMETHKGTIEVGKLADVAVLSQDLFTIPVTAVPATVSLLTVVDGEVVYSADALPVTEGR